MMSTVLDILKRNFIRGVLVVVPFILTYIVLEFLFDIVDGILEPALSNLLGYYRTGLGLLTTLLIILLAGILTRNFLGDGLYRLGDRVAARVPLIRPIYSASKQLIEAMTKPSGKTFQEVALIEYPRKGSYALCFVSQWVTLESGRNREEYGACFVPSTPTPLSGMAVLIPRQDILPLDLSVEDAVKYLVSGGVASPETFSVKTPDEIIVKEGSPDEVS